MSQTRGLAAILAADVAGYSRLIGADEGGTLKRLGAIWAELMDPKIAERHDRIVKTMDDGLLVEFASVVDALRCASEVQVALAERNAPIAADHRIELRIGATSEMSSSRKVTSLATASMSQHGLRAWPSRAGSASRRACRRMLRAVSTSPSMT
jgi:class 3 adenylate cyclase